MQYRFTIHQIETGYQGFFTINRHTVSFEKFEGGYIEEVVRECGKKVDIVGVVPYDPVRKEFLLVEQFRIGMVVREEHPWTYEIVAGFMDVAGEKPEQTAVRELFEETGCKATSLHSLIDYYPSPGSSASKNHIFIATVDSSKALDITGISDEGENIRVHRISLDSVKQWLKSGKLSTSTAIIAFQQFLLGDWENRLLTAEPLM